MHQGLRAEEDLVRLVQTVEWLLALKVGIHVESAHVVQQRVAGHISQSDLSHRFRNVEVLWVQPLEQRDVVLVGPEDVLPGRMHLNPASHPRPETLGDLVTRFPRLVDDLGDARAG